MTGGSAARYALLSGLLLLSSGCAKNEPTRPLLTAAETDELLGPVEIAYFVEGSASSISVTVEIPTGTSQTTTGVPLTNKGGTEGLHFEFARGEFVYISAQNQHGSGTVTCRIEVDGRVISENTASGGYSIASCDGAAK